MPEVARAQTVPSADAGQGQEALENSLENTVVEFLRAVAALEAPIPSDDQNAAGLPFYRLRDVALATDDLVRAMVRVSGLLRADASRGTLRENIAAIAGADAGVLEAVEALGGLRNAHNLAYLGKPPVEMLAAGRAAALTVATFVDAIFGDAYAPRDPGGGRP